MKLLENPASYQALKKELDELLVSPSDPIVDENTCNLPYLNAVIHETLRMLPPAAGGKKPCFFFHRPITNQNERFCKASTGSCDYWRLPSSCWCKSMQI
jgi:hypothetical protein